jgi:hypothetical protein
MSQANPKTTPVPPPPAESQSERWLKYGTNVAVASIAVVVIALLLVWLSGKYNNRLDTTAAGLYSLKPQTLNVIRNNSQPIKIVSLYTRVQPERSALDEETEREVDRAQVVADLLEEYQEKGKNISVETIDPAMQSAKVDQLIEEVIRTSGAELQKYKDVVNAFPQTYEKIAAIAKEQRERVQGPLSKLEDITDPELAQSIMLLGPSIQGVPKNLERIKEGMDKRLKQKIPDYKGAVDAIGDNLSGLSQILDSIIESFRRLKDDAKLPADLRKYMADNLPRYEEMKKLADDLDKQIKGLGELKLDQLKESLRQPNNILVMGASEWRVLPIDKVWQVPEDTRGFTPEGKLKPRFAGEQQVTGAIISLTSKAKTKVAFIRPGGPPLASADPFRGSGPLSRLASRLRDYNFEVVEKDITGMWEMQARMQGGFAAPEPPEDQIKDAIWVVINFPSQRGPMPGGGDIANKLASHLKAGGSALILSLPNADNLSVALDEWGVKLRTDAVAVHEAVKPGAARASDFIEEALRMPYLFSVKEYGDHPIAKAVNSLEGILIAANPVQIVTKSGYTATPLVPIPQTLKSWGETDLDKLLRDESGPGTAEFDPVTDIPAPIYCGAVVEKQGGGRLVVIGSAQMPMNDIVRLADPELARQGIYVSRFPANIELAINSVFHLAKMDHMMALSPAAMEVPRLKEIPRGALNFWRIGVLLVLLPLAVVASGVGVYLKRRD